MAKKTNSRSKKTPDNGGDATDPEPRGPDGRLSVLIELRGRAGNSAVFARSTARGMDVDALQIDPEFEPVPLGGGGEGQARGGEETYLVRGTVQDESELDALRAHPDVARVWPDVPIAPFAEVVDQPEIDLVENPASAACPIPPCDCSPLTARGTIADVATYLRANEIWAAGFRGAGVVVGVVDSGITAQGRPVLPGQTSRRIDRVIGGWPTATWGTQTVWGEHGNMCATGVLGMAPEAQLYDLRIGGAGDSTATISRAIQAYQWAINQHRLNGTPHVLTNSWGIYKESWAPGYARDPNHPFTRKVVEAMNEGILVLFAAGNCGDTCPNGRCGSDTGPGKSIWGANGHERVMTVGAVNRNEEFVGYSSQGPAALHADKPDFCSVTHYKGYYPQADNGTSAATPVAAGIVALLKQVKSSLTQDQARAALKATAKDIGPGGFDRHSGAGIIRPHEAYDRVRFPVFRTDPLRDTLRTLPNADLLRTDPRRDTLRTLPSVDLVRTAPVLDLIGTSIGADLGTLPQLDQGRTDPSIDHRKSPFLDTIDEGAKPPGDRFPDPTPPPFPNPGRPGERPFVLETPHRAPNWQAAAGGAGNGLAAEIEQVAAYYHALLAAYYGDDSLGAEYGDGSGYDEPGGSEYDY